MKTLWIDSETHNSETDIKAGVYAYARTAEVMLISYAIDDGPAKVWDRTEDPDIPEDLNKACWEVGEGTRLAIAHNSQFDRVVFHHAMPGFICTKPEVWRCTMTKAMAHGFPGGLDALCGILGVSDDHAKLKDGKALIRKFCLPAPKNHKADRYDRHSHPEEWERFKEYARLDIDAMRAVDAMLPDWNYRNGELALWHLDQKINDRGFCVDMDLVEAGITAAETEKEKLATRFRELTGGEVNAPTQRAQFQAYLNQRFGLSLGNTRSATFKALLSDSSLDLKPECRELMEISINANKTSTAKYAALKPAVTDGRFCGGLQFAGAARTRRWAGRTFQPQNLPSRGLPKDVDDYIRALKNGAHDMLFDDLMTYGAAALRGVVTAPEGKKLVVSDLSNIEGRCNAWLTGETWKLEAFEANDRGEGEDLYKITAGSILGKEPCDITDAERNSFGKVPELALGYGSGVHGLQTFAKGYGVNFADQWEVIKANVGKRLVAEAFHNWKVFGFESGVDEIEWIACESVKLAWRHKNDRIAANWKALENAARAAVENPGKAYQCGKLKLKAAGHAGHNWLIIRLPSGNFLTYFNPGFDDRGQLTYLGVNGLTRKWERLKTYGGKLVENCCQSLSRDVMGHNMPSIEDAGFRIVLTVHDEVVTEAEDTRDFNSGRLSDLLKNLPLWAQGFPLEADGFVADRYKK